MKCPECGCEDSKVLRTTTITGDVETIITRERSCAECNNRYHTYECMELPGSRERKEIVVALSSLTTAIKWLLPVGQRVPVVRDAVNKLKTAVESLQTSNK